MFVNIEGSPTMFSGIVRQKILYKKFIFPMDLPKLFEISSSKNFLGLTRTHFLEKANNKTLPHILHKHKKSQEQELRVSLMSSLMREMFLMIYLLKFSRNSFC